MNALYRTNNRVYNTDTLTLVLKTSIRLRKINVTVFLNVYCCKRRSCCYLQNPCPLIVVLLDSLVYNEDWKELRQLSSLPWILFSYLENVVLFHLKLFL